MNAERRVELTSSAWLFNPERLFWIAGHLNRKRPTDAQVSVELYPTHYCMGFPLGPGRIDKDKISSWQKEHGPVPVERIHMPFHWSWPTAVENFFFHSLFRQSARYQPGKPRDRIIAMALGWMTTTVQNKFATELAEDLGAGLNAHVHIIEEAAKRGRLPDIIGRARETLVENHTDYPRSQPEHIETETDPQRAVSVVEKHGLDGVIYGVDHAFELHLDPIEILSKNIDGLRKTLKVVHLAGSDGYRNVPTDKDELFWQAVKYIGNQSFENEVAFCLDLSPFEMRHLTQDQQLVRIKEVLEKLESV